MRARASGLLAALTCILGCGRSGLELDEPSAAGAGGASGAGGVAVGGSGAGGAAGTGGLVASGAGGKAGACDLAFSDNGPIGDAVSTFTSVSSGFVCASPGEVDPDKISIALESALGRVEGTLAWNAAEGRLAFTPSAPLALATPYTATASLPGATLSWSFTTTEGMWQPEEELGLGADLALAVSPDGRGIVGFQVAGAFWVRRFTLQDGVARSDELVSPGPIAPRSLRVAMASGGAAVAAWATEEGVVRARHAALDGGFVPSPDLDPLFGPAIVEDLALASDGTGVLVTSVRSNPNEPGSLRAIPIAGDVFGASNALSPVVPLDGVRAEARPGGRSWIVWNSWAETGRVLGRHAARSGDFDPSRVLAEPAARAGFTAMAPDGSLFVVWQDGSPPNAVKAARFRPEGGAVPYAVLDTRAPGLASSGVYARIAADERGRAMALWVNQGATDHSVFEEIRAQRFDDGWASEHVPLSRPPTVGEWAVISPMGLALDPHGNGFAAFGHFAPAHAWVRRFREAEGWEPPVELATSATAPLVAVDASGRAAVAWASGGKVFLRRFIELTAPRPRH